MICCFTSIRMPPVMPVPLLQYWKSKCIDPTNISSFESVLKNPWPVRNTANSTSVHRHPSQHYLLHHTQSFLICMKTRRAETEGVITDAPHKDFQPFTTSSKPRRVDVHVCLIERAERTKRRSIVDFNKTLFTGPIIFNLMAEGGSSKEEHARSLMSHYAWPSWAETNWRRIIFEETGRPRALRFSLCVSMTS